MQDNELIDEFIRIDKVETGIKILVCLIEWEGPHTPITRWVIGVTIPNEASEIEVRKATTAILKDSRFFRICTECNERQPNGWMHDERICHGCAEANHGVIH